MSTPYPGPEPLRRLCVRRRAWLAGLPALALAPQALCAPVMPNDPVTLSVPGPGGSVALPLELAQRLRLDDAAGIALRLRFVGGGGIALHDLQAETAAFAVLGLPAAMHANQTGAGLVALAAIDDLPLYALVVRSALRPQVRRVADLRGLSIGVHSNSLASKTTSQQVVELLLHRHGVPLESIRFINAGQSWQTQHAALLSGTVDASMTEEPFALRLAALGVAYSLYATGNPEDAKTTPGAGFLRAVLLARRGAVEANPGLAAKVVAMIVSTLRWIAEHDAAALADALQLPAGGQRDAVIAMRAHYPRQFSSDGRFSMAQIEQTRLFYRASHAADPAAQAFEIEPMLLDRFAGRKP